MAFSDLLAWADADLDGQYNIEEYIARTIPTDDGSFFYIREITVPGGSVEHWNREAGEVWMGRLLEAYPRAIWLNPVPQRYWQRTPSTELIRGLMAERMFPLTLSGLEDGIAHLKGSRSRH